MFKELSVAIRGNVIDRRRRHHRRASDNHRSLVDDSSCPHRMALGGVDFATFI